MVCSVCVKTAFFRTSTYSACPYVNTYSILVCNITENVIHTTQFVIFKHIQYILESNPHPFYSFRRLKNHMRIRIACGLHSRSRAGFWKNDRAAVRAVRTIPYNNLLFIIYIIYYL